MKWWAASKPWAAEYPEWKIGQRVGVGLLPARMGVRALPTWRHCKLSEPGRVGSDADGGYAEVMIAEARALSLVPDELASAEAGPLLCAGVTTYNALRNAGCVVVTWLRCRALAAWASGLQFARRWDSILLRSDGTREGEACERFGRARLHR